MTMTIMTTTPAPPTFGVRQGGGLAPGLGSPMTWFNTTPWAWGALGIALGGLAVYFGVDRHCRR